MVIAENNDLSFLLIFLYLYRDHKYCYDRDLEMDIEVLATILEVVVFTQSASCFRECRQIALLILLESKRINEILFSHQSSENHLKTYGGLEW